MKAIIVFSLFFLCACSSSRISDVNVNEYNSGEPILDLTTELSNLPRVVVRGEGRLASIDLTCGSKASFILNGNLEPEYAYVYDRVQASKLKSVRVRNISDATKLGLRDESSTVIIIETE